MCDDQCGPNIRARPVGDLGRSAEIPSPSRGRVEQVASAVAARGRPIPVPAGAADADQMREIAMSAIKFFGSVADLVDGQAAWRIRFRSRSRLARPYI